MHFICHIDREIYKVVTPDIRTDEVILTDERIQHIKEHHPNDFETFADHLTLILQEPDYILEANKPNTAFILKAFQVENKRFQLILRLITAAESTTYVNSVITFLKISDRKWHKYLRNKKILYSRMQDKV